MALPGLRCDDPPVAHALAVHPTTAGLFELEPHVSVAGELFSANDSGDDQYLNAVADGENPFSAAMKLANEADNSRLMPQKLRRTPADAQDGGVLGHFHLSESEGTRDAVAGPFDIGVPVRLEVVKDAMEQLAFRGGDDGTPAGFKEAVPGVVDLERLAGVVGDDQKLFRHQAGRVGDRTENSSLLQDVHAPGAQLCFCSRVKTDASFPLTPALSLREREALGSTLRFLFQASAVRTRYAPREPAPPCSLSLRERAGVRGK